MQTVIKCPKLIPLIIEIVNKNIVGAPAFLLAAMLCVVADLVFDPVRFAVCVKMQLAFGFIGAVNNYIAYAKHPEEKRFLNGGVPYPV